MINLDTNVLARYLVRDEPRQYAAAAAVIDALTPEHPGFVTHVALAELLWTLQRTYRFPRETRLAVVRSLVQADAIEFEDGESVVQALTRAEAGADFADALIEASGMLFGVAETVTFDRDASRHLGWRLLDAG